MWKKLWIVLCAFVLVGCATEVDGTAVAEDAWHGLGVTTTSVPSTPKPGRPVDFDPCAPPAGLLRDLGLPGATKFEMPAGQGCAWSSGTVGITLAMTTDTSFIESPSTNPMVSALEVLPDGGYTTYLFVLDGDMYLSQTMTDAGAVTMTFTDVADDSLTHQRSGLFDAVGAVWPYLPPPR